MRLKVSNAYKIPAEARKYDKYVVQGLNMIDGIQDVEFNYVTGSVLIKYDTNKVYEEKIVKWINKVIEIVLENISFIEEYGNTDIDYVISTLEQKLQEEIKSI